MFSKRNHSTKRCGNNAIIRHWYATNFRKRRRKKKKKPPVRSSRKSRALPVITSVNSYGTMKGNTRITSIYRNKGGPLLNGSLMDPRFSFHGGTGAVVETENRIEIKAPYPHRSQLLRSHCAVAVPAL